MKKLVLIFAAARLFAGQSMLLNSSIQNLSVPNIAVNRVEMYLHNWSNTIGTHVLVPNPGTSDATGWLVDIAITGQNTQIFAYNPRESGCLSSACATGFVIAGQGSTLSTPGVYLRFQENSVTHTTTAEAWDTNGNRFAFTQWTYTTYTPTGAGFQAGANDLGSPTDALAWVRVHTTLLPLNSRPPTTVDNANRLLEWKLDGTLADASGNGYTATVKVGFVAPSYIPTPYQIDVSVIKTLDALSWTNTVSQRAGTMSVLDGTSSFSQADASNSVTCFWQLLSGPTTPYISDRTVCQPVVTGLSFGDYQWQLTVTDASNQVAASSAHIGAVSTDSNGVVVNANPVVDAIFGPIVAWGKNIWGYADYWHLNALNLRAGPSGAYNTSGWNGRQWEKIGVGSTSYFFNGIGQAIGNHTVTPTGTTLGAGINATTLVIPVVSAAQIDLSDLPTRITLFAGNGPGIFDAREEIRICSQIDATHLQACYDGRGSSPWGEWTGSAVIPFGGAQAWPSGTTVSQFKLKGAGTGFFSDANAAICPLGVGPPGPAQFSGGSVTLTPGSATVTSTGTDWTGLTVGQAGPSSGVDFIRVQATHASQPFVFVANVITGGAGASVSLSGGGVSAVTPFGSGTFGVNYVSGAVDVVISDPTGSGAAVTANVVAGQITSYTVTASGSNYTQPTMQARPRSIILSRPYPSDADTGTYSNYAIMKGARTVVLRSPHYSDPTNFSPDQLASTFWGTNGCETESTAYLNANFLSNSIAAGHDTLFDGHLLTAMPYSVTDTSGYVNPGPGGGISFYNEGDASMMLYLRSGLQSSLDAANTINDWLVRSGWMYPASEGWPPLITGGPAIGAFRQAIVRNPSLWPYARDFAANGETLVSQSWNGGTPRCDIQDTRNGGYTFTWLVFAALYDPDPTFRARWQSSLPHMLSVDQTCAGADFSWSNSLATWNTGNGASPTKFALTNNSTAGTGVGIPPSACTGTAQGTGTVVNGSGVLTITSGTFPTSGSDGVTITGTASSVAFTGSYQTAGIGGSTIQFTALWPGDTGAVTWMSNNADVTPMTAYGVDGNDKTDLVNSYNCIWNNSTSITLDHPWKGATSAGGVPNYWSWPSPNISGWGQQPFYVGIKSYQMDYLAQCANSGYAAIVTACADTNVAAVVSGYATLLAGGVGWLKASGIDPIVHGVNYGAGYGYCAAPNTGTNTDPSLASISWMAPECTYQNTIGSAPYAREQNGELNFGLNAFYLLNQTTPNKTFGDQFYGAVFGNPPYNTGGAYSDSFSTALFGLNLSDQAVAAGKWYGFFGGMGDLSGWPAVRFGGVAAAIPRTIPVPFALASVPNAAKIQALVLQPDGKMNPTVCTSSPCMATGADAREGNYALVEVDYLNSSNVVISKGDLVPIYVQ